MLAISKEQVAYHLYALCSDKSPAELVQEIKETGLWINPTQQLCYVAGVYYLLERFHILVDGVLINSQSTRAGAFALVDKYCQLLFMAHEVMIVCNNEIIIKWARIGRTQWVQRYK